jgi:hypothetical protein
VSAPPALEAVPGAGRAGRRDRAVVLVDVGDQAPAVGVRSLRCARYRHGLGGVGDSGGVAAVSGVCLVLLAAAAVGGLRGDPPGAVKGVPRLVRGFAVLRLDQRGRRRASRDVRGRGPDHLPGRVVGGVGDDPVGSVRRGGLGFLRPAENEVIDADDGFHHRGPEAAVPTTDRALASEPEIVVKVILTSWTVPSDAEPGPTRIELQLGSAKYNTDRCVELEPEEARAVAKALLAAADTADDPATG